MKKNMAVILSFLLFSAALLSGPGDCAAGTYVYKNENGEKVLFLPKDSKDMRPQDKGYAEKKKGVPAGTPFKHKKKTSGQDIKK